MNCREVIFFLLSVRLAEIFRGDGGVSRLDYAADKVGSYSRLGEQVLLAVRVQIIIAKHDGSLAVRGTLHYIVRF